MNMILKSAIAGALALAATSAFSMGTPESGQSDLILIVQNNNTPANVYALDTGISIDSIFPTSGLKSNAVLDTSIAGLNTTIAASATLQSFLSANPAASDGWTLEAGQYTQSIVGGGPSNKATVTPGFAKAVFTSPGTASNIGQVGLPGLQNLLGGIQTDVGVIGGGLNALQTATESTAVSYSANAASKYGTYQSTSDLGAVGSGAIALYGFTGNGDKVSTQNYILGSATLAADGTLTLTANGGGTPPPPVPLPAAVWLFGSGLMGLVGISRRRKGAAATV